MTTDEPEEIPQPGDGSTLPTMPPLRADYDCALDSLAYYPDGRLVLIRPAGALQDEIIQCDLAANTTGCTVQLSTNGNTFQVFGDPTRDNVLITLKPTAETAWFPVRINTSTDYNVSFPVNPANWSSHYNITNIQSDINCTSTDPPPLPDPLPLGWGCYAGASATERVAVYRPLDSVNQTFLGPVYLYAPDNDTTVEVDEVTPLACQATGVPGYDCALGPRYFGERLGIMLPGNAFYALDVIYSNENFLNPNPCNGSATSLPRNTTCRNNRLYYQYNLNTEPKPIVAENSPQIVPCLAVRPDDYVCSVNSTGPALAGNGTMQLEMVYNHNNNASDYTTVPCIQNTATVPPTCVRVEIEYASGVNATIEISGVDVRVSIDGVRQQMRCTSPSFNSNSIESNATNATTAMVQVEQYYGVHVDAFAPALTFEQRMQIAKARAREALRTPMSMTGSFVNAMNVTLYPKNSLVCCVSRTLRSMGRFFVSFAFEIIYTARSLLTLPAAIPGYVFEVPTFRDALEDVRDAVCELACTLTRIIPAEYRCDTFTTDIGCTSGPTCAQGLLCHIADAVLLLAEILVEILETIRDLTDNEGSVPAGSPILGEDCGINNVGDCVSSVIVYVIVKVIFTLTQIARDLAANIDCLLCAITSANGTNFCTPGLFMVIDPLTRLIEGLVDGVLAVIIKIGISIISLFVYLFTGEIDRFVSELTNIFTLIGEVITNFAEMVLEFFLSLPGIKEIVNFFNTVIAGACNFLEDAINAFAGDNPVDLDCPSASKKRAILAPGWLPPLPSDAWDAMNRACHAAVTEFNATDSASLTEENERELGVCYSSKYWLVDVPAAAALDGYTNDCDYRMPEILSKNARWTSLSAEERSKAFDCTRYRHGTRLVQREMPFVPRDIADNPARIPDFLEQMLFAYSTFNQYRQDRLYPASTVLGSDYAANWEDGGYNTAHLETLRGFSKQDAQAMLDADDDTAPTFLTLQAYAHRAVDLDHDTPRALWRRARTRNPEQIGDAMRFFNHWLGPSSTTSSTKRSSTSSKAAHVAAQFIEFALNHTARHRVLPPPSVNISDVVSGTSRVPHGYLLFTGLLIDIPALLSRTILGARDHNLAARSYTAGATTAQVAYAGVVAAFGVVRDLFGGRHMAQTRAPSVAGVNVSAHLPTRTIWRSTMTGERTTLTATMNNLWTSLSKALAPAFTMAGEHPMVVYNQFMRLATASPEAQLRRTRLLALMAGTRASLSSALLRDASSARVEDTELQALLTASGGGMHAANLTCDTNFTGLCENCLYLDRAIGRLETGVEVTSIYYQGNATQEPSYAFSRAQFQSTRTYLADPLATVIVGDSPNNPVRWPWHDRSQFRIVGDPTPNKLRFSDLGSLLQDSLDALFGNNTGDLSALLGDVSGVGALGSSVLATVATALPDVRAHSTATPQDVLLGWLDYFWSWFRTCAYRSELDGTRKRFAIGESVLIIGGIALFLGLVAGQLFPSQMIAFLGGATFIASSAVLFGTLVVAYDWSYLCGFALPQQTADDIMYFLVHTLFARGPWLPGGIIKNSSFTNDQAGICANYASAEEGGYAYAHCVDEVGFKDFGYVLGFMLRTLSPTTLEAINTTQIIILRDIVQLAWVQERLNAFKDTYNASDPVSYSIHNSCAYVYTFWSHYAVAQLALRVFFILRPLISLLASLIVGLFLIAAMAALLMLALMRYLLVIPWRVATARARALRDDDVGGGSGGGFGARSKLHWRDATAVPLPRRFAAVVHRYMGSRFAGYRVF